MIYCINFKLTNMSKKYISKKQKETNLPTH